VKNSEIFFGRHLIHKLQVYKLPIWYSSQGGQYQILLWIVFEVFSEVFFEIFFEIVFEILLEIFFEIFFKIFFENILFGHWFLAN
jgi:hypothetical protein